MTVERIEEVQADFAAAAGEPARPTSTSSSSTGRTATSSTVRVAAQQPPHRQYGGSLENRFGSCRDLRRCEAAIGDDFPLGYRISGTSSPTAA